MFNWLIITASKMPEGLQKVKIYLYEVKLGTSQQDPTTNNGKPVGDALELPPLDAIFLAREK
jgi:hypothetical protein